MLEYLIITSLSILAIHVCITWEGMIFNSLHSWLDLHTPNWLNKPLYGCLICMSSIWGSIFWWGFVAEGLVTWYWWPVGVLCVAGLNAIIIHWMNAIAKDEVDSKPVTIKGFKMPERWSEEELAKFNPAKLTILKPCRNG